MTATAISETTTAPAARPPGSAGRSGVRVTQGRVIRSEWIKLRSLRSSWITLAVAAAGTIGISALVCWAADNRWNHMSPLERLTFDPVFHSLVGVELAQLAIGVLGVLFIAGEYGTGMIRSTLGAVPKRLPVLWAKIAVFAVATLVVSLIATFIAFGLGQDILGVHGTSLSAPNVLRSVIGAALYLTVVGILGIGLGFIVRNTAGGIATLFGLLLVLPGLTHALPSSWQQHILPYLPSDAGGSVFSVARDPGSLSAWTGFGVFCAWAAAAVLLGALALRRRDA